jgi:uncharacterized Tic20 family protein
MNVNDKNKTYISLIHFSQFAGVIIPILGLILPIVMWQVKKEDSSIDAHGRVVVNWIISQLIYGLVFFILIFFVIGYPLLIILGILSIIFTIIGGIKALDGIVWRYPLSINFFRINNRNQNYNNFTTKIDSNDISLDMDTKLISVGEIDTPTIFISNKQNLSLGRTISNDIIINNQYISSKHLEISMLNNKIYIQDTNSSNGTYIDGEKILPRQKKELRPNNRLIVGSEAVIYMIK